MKNSVHAEPISEFIHFLIENGVQKEVIIAYLKYHYADGTTNGSGLTRQSVEEYKAEHLNEIELINNAFNKSDILNKAIERFVLKGRNDEYEVDAIIHGQVNDFMWITKEEIKSIIMKNKNLISSSVHFGQLFCQPLARCLNYNPRYEKDRFSIQIKWYSLFDDIIRAMNERIKW